MKIGKFYPPKQVSLIREIKFLQNSLADTRNMYTRWLAEKDIQIAELKERLRLQEQRNRDLDMYLQQWVLVHPQENSNGALESKD